MFLKNHRYVSEKTYVCFWKNIGMFLEKHTYVFLKTKVCFFENKGVFLRAHWGVGVKAWYTGFSVAGAMVCPTGALSVGWWEHLHRQVLRSDSLMRAFGFDDVKSFSHRLSLIYA